MILLFKDRSDGAPIFVGVSDKNLISLASRSTSFIFLPLQDFKNLLKPEAWLVVEKMIEKFSSLSGASLVDEVKLEMGLSADFVREISVAEYKKFVR